ncbi:uncharacterized protein EV420DRAFT_1639641 [Desarmillaria tabescens]|uniref:F-box domain-containing protein n=1 Tax=Armillaria tabescens TaxID=1929756 RepID=A0AA39NB81_ARMTA|nr:uncharacterized protein EV420DRAFT_1639641 [Desarmillaria tabescens]KAK0462423.1 hypothetical protein EV420DRAFT_1639641 [Desarmillaria tabescens]
MSYISWSSSLPNGQVVPNSSQQPNTSNANCHSSHRLSCPPIDLTAMIQKKNKGKKRDTVLKTPKSEPSDSKIRQGKARSTAINRINECLPNELLAYIFATAINSLFPISHSPFLAVVCSICRHWRDVAIEASELWTTIYIHDQSHIPPAELFLERSKTRLLDVDVQVIFGRGGSRMTGPATFNLSPGLRVAELTSVHLVRTRTLSLKVGDIQGADFFSLFYRATSTPHLVSLSIDVKGSPRGAPLLLDSIYSFRSNGSKGLPSNTASISRLTRLELTTLRHEDIRTIFMYFSSLEILILPKFGQNWIGSRRENQPIVLASSTLRSFAVQLDHTHNRFLRAPGNCSCALGSLRFPNLEYLEVLGDNSSYNPNLGSHFKDMSKLQVLRLQRCSVSPADAEFFRSLISLNRLELVDNLKDVEGFAIHCITVSLPFPHLSSILLSGKSGRSHGISQWVRLARLAVQNCGCTKFSIEVTARHHRRMLLASLGPQDERIHVETTDLPPGLLYPLPTNKLFDWSDHDEEDYYDSDVAIDSIYGFDSSDYESLSENLTEL